MASSRMLTSDRMPFLAYAFTFPGTLLMLLACFLWFQTFDTFRAISNGAPTIAIRCDYTVTPASCTKYSVTHNSATRALIGVVLFILGAASWPIGFREREVWLSGSTVLITWGHRLPLTIHRYHAPDITSMTITKEARFVVTPVPGSVTRVSSAPDRWRLRGTLRSKPINLGSYTTEFEAQRAKERIQETATDPEAGIYHYGRA